MHIRKLFDFVYLLDGALFNNKTNASQRKTIMANDRSELSLNKDSTFHP
jgi:hypothetical protein